MSARPRISASPRLSATLQLLARYESPNVTFMARDGSWPIVWSRAKGTRVWDEQGAEYLDLTAAFGVAASGHANGAVVRAGQKQMAQLLHAMGDVHPHPQKAALARELSRITFERWHGSEGRSIFCNSGFEAVEAALKTALLATGRSRVLAFRGAYHGLGYGTLNTTERNYFRAPFHSQLAGFGEFEAFPRSEEELAGIASNCRRRLRSKKIGAILVEPVQGRGGINVPPPNFLPLLRKLADESGALLIFDEIYTGFGRTGRWFAAEHSQTVPDLVCVGKALAGGFPISACIGRADLMNQAWPKSHGEALHTSTFLGHPVGCAMALAQIAEITKKKLVGRADRFGSFLRVELERWRDATQPKLAQRGVTASVRGIGLMVGVELTSLDGQPAGVLTMDWVKRLLRCGFIFLPEGEHGNVLSITPPLIISMHELMCALAAMEVEMDYMLAAK